MKKIICMLLCAVFIYTAFLCSCGGHDDPYTPYTPDSKEQTSTDAPAETAAQTVTDAQTEAKTETQTETEAETEPPAPSPYGIFTYNENAVNVTVTAPHAILIDANTKEILYMNCEPDEKMYPASTTKLLTAIVALHNCEPDVIFKPGDELSLVASDSTIAYVKTNHELSLEMLIEGMLLPSGGDAAYVVAAGVGRKIAGDDGLSAVDAVKAFVAEMNRYGKEVLGLTGSNFTCPDGYHDDEHYTTIIDMMTIAYAALQEPIIMKYAQLASDDVRYASGHKNTWTNTNKLLDQDSQYFYENATGLKTGTTDEAGCCLISSAAFSTKKVLAGVFGAKDNKERFNDSRALLVVGINR